MKTQALLMSCFLVLSCSNTVQQQSSALATKTAAAQIVKPQGPVRIEANKPVDIVDLRTVTSKVQISMAYASNNNFTGKVVPRVSGEQLLFSKKCS